MIKFVTDSTSCVSSEYAKKHNISVVSLTTTIDNYSIAEGFEPSWGPFYQKLKESKNFPKTSQPTPQEFEAVYESAFKADPNAEIIVLTISTSLSGTYNSARLAADSVNPNRIHVIDSGANCQSILLFLEELVALAQSGKTAKEIVEASHEIRNKVCITFVPQTMEYLKRGGRIDLLSATIASVLNIKPILTFKDGKLTNTKKCLGMQKAITELISEVPSTVKKLYVCYIHEAGDWLQKTLEKARNAFSHLTIGEPLNIGPVVGSHIGIGAVGIAYITA